MKKALFVVEAESLEEAWKDMFNKIHKNIDEELIIDVKNNITHEIILSQKNQMKPTHRLTFLTETQN